MKKVRSKAKRAGQGKSEPAAKASSRRGRGVVAKTKAVRQGTAKKAGAGGRAGRTAGKKAATRKTVRGAAKKRVLGAVQAGKLFAETSRQGGCACLLVTAERVNGQWDYLQNVVDVVAKPGGRRGRGVAGKSWERTCETLAALGHVGRARMLLKMLEGPATYRALQKVSKLKAGPLYHHVNQLRLAGLILPKQRDLYELTRGGRNVMLVALGLTALIRDKRRRPVE